MTEEQRTIASNIRRIRERITESAQRAGRSAENIALIAITKYANLAQTRAVALAGLKNLGESRPQVLWEKSSALEGDAIRWHLVGHLQDLHHHQLEGCLSKSALIIVRMPRAGNVGT